MNKSLPAFSNTAKVGVIGLGKLGLPIGARIAELGYEVVGYDKNEKLIIKLNQKIYDFIEPHLNDILENVINNFKFTTQIQELDDCGIVYVVLPTPSNENGVFEDSLIHDSVMGLVNIWESNGTVREKTVVVVSTVMPGSCEQLLNRVRKKTKNKINLIYSPEFIALGTVIHNLNHPDSILIGISNDSNPDAHLEIQKLMTKNAPHQIMTLTEAEIVKLMINCYVTMKISFANSIGEIAMNFGDVNAQIIARGIGMDSRIGSKYIRPGLGFAGPCFPRDVEALIALSQGLGTEPNLAIAIKEVNARQPSLLVERIKKDFTNTKNILIIGLAYKINTTIIEGSQTIMVAELLSVANYNVHVYDPLIKNVFSKSNIKELSILDKIDDFDLIIVANSFQSLILNIKVEPSKVIFV